MDAVGLQVTYYPCTYRYLAQQLLDNILTLSLKICLLFIWEEVTGAGDVV